MPVPNTFANATTSIPLSQLDNNFATPITIGNTAVQLGNTVTTLNNMTFANVSITSGTANAVTIGNGTFTNYTESQVNIGNSSTTQTIALSNGTVQTVTLTGNCTFTMPSVAEGKSFLVLIKSGAGNFTGTFTNVKFPGNTAPTITNTASRMDIIAFSSDGTNWYGTASQNYYV
jgi:hypothetical protein